MEMMETKYVLAELDNDDKVVGVYTDVVDPEKGVYHHIYTSDIHKAYKFDSREEAEGVQSHVPFGSNYTIVPVRKLGTTKSRMNIDYSSLIHSPLMRMSEIRRYSSTYQECDETLSDHVVDVLMISYLIASNFNKNRIKDGMNDLYNIEKLMCSGLFHDIDETITGDIPRNTKYATETSKSTLEEVANKSVRLLEDISGVDLYEVWSSAKDGKEGLLIALADLLSVVKKSVTEIVLRSNMTFLKVVVELEGHLETFDKKIDARVDSIRGCEAVELKNLVSSAKEEVSGILNKYKGIIDTYRIRENVLYN